VQVEDAHTGVQPGHQLDTVERLGEEVVGAGFERLGQVFRRVPRGEHHEVGLQAQRGGAHRAADLGAFESRHAPVEDGQQRRPGHDQAGAGLQPVDDDFDLVAPQFERPHQDGAGNRIVVGDEDAHVGCSGTQRRGRRGFGAAGGGAGRYSISTPLTTA
jgi:hypothetical protein